MLFAGGVTVGDTSLTGFFYILSEPKLYAALKEEIMSIWPDPKDLSPSLEELEKLPLLNATIKESLRMAPGACSPLLRIVPSLGTTISNKFIPASTIVGQSSLFVHNSPAIFASPNKFQPERWLPSNPGAKELKRWLVAFSRGPRSCLGVNLAWCELLMLYASLLRRFEMVADGTVERDLEWRDCFTPFYGGRHSRAFCRPVESRSPLVVEACCGMRTGKKEVEVMKELAD